MTSLGHDATQYVITSEDCALGDPTTYKRIFSDWSNFSRKHPKRLRSIVRSGVPDQKTRRELWERLTDCKDAADKYPGLYAKLSQSIGDTDIVETIKKDLHRTYPQYELFAEKDGPGQTSLLNILKAYAFFDNQVGYVQGMAFITGFLFLTLFNAETSNTNIIDTPKDVLQGIEETTFWILVQILNHKKYSMKDCYRTGLPKLRLIMFMIDELLKLRFPDIHEHLTDQMLIPEVYVSPFIIALFTNRFPYKTSLRLFDMFLCEGWKIMIRTMLALLKFSKNDIVKKNTAEIIPHLYKVAQTMPPMVLIEQALSIKLPTKIMIEYALKYEKKLPKNEQEKITTAKRNKKKIKDRLFK